MDELELRELRYFVAVAEELNFTRAAERLGMAQPPLSRAIRRIEAKLGVRVLDRSTRRVELTEAGRVLLHHARFVVDAAAAARRRTQRAGGRRAPLVVVLKAGGDGGILEPTLARFREEPDCVEVEVVVCGWGQQIPMLRDGRADVALLRIPWDTGDLAEHGLDAELVLTDSQVAVLPAGHRLAGRSSLLMADLAAETFVRWPGEPEPNGDAPARPAVHDTAQLLEIVALGQAIAVLPASVRRFGRVGLAYVPVADAQSSSVLVVWPQLSRSRAVAAFVRAAASVEHLVLRT